MLRQRSKNSAAIQAVLEDAEKQQVEKASVRNWLDGLNDVSYEMAEVIDEWNTEILKQKALEVVSAEKKKTFKKVCFSVTPNCFCFRQVNKATRLYRIATEIKELNEKLTLIADQKNQFQFHQSSTRRNDEQLIKVFKPLETSSFVKISEIFGREKATADLLSKLSSESSEEGKSALIIPIVGMGGMGKTTLAQLAYNNKNVETRFQERVWVCVSDPFDGVEIAKAIIRGIDNTPPDSTVLQEVLRCMSTCLEGKKCLIVLDDVWTEDQNEWESLKLSVIMEACAKDSKIVVTTRKEKVAEIMGATAQMIHLEKLSDVDCLALFNSIAYSGRKEDGANGFGAIGEEIAKKCNGLPLAARTLGTLMRNKKKRGEWLDVLNSNIWALQEVERHVFRPLLLSYYELIPTVRRCLLYCATFPKNYRFWKHNLIELWMSQDYLNKETKGQNVFDTLVMQSFFQDVVEEEDEEDTKIATFCKMHDIVHDFLQFLNKNEFFTAEYNREDKNIISISEEVRHLTIMFAPFTAPLSVLISLVNCKKLRTLATFDSDLSGIELGVALSQMKCLRTLNLRKNDIRVLAEELGELIHLRYLDSSENEKLENLPDSLGNLYNLQTLCLTNCYWLRALPVNMGNLISLRHLHNQGCDRLEYLPRGMARLTSLQTLRRCPLIHVDGDPDEGLKLGDLGSLDQLQGSLLIQIVGNLKDTNDAQRARLWNKKLWYLNLEIHKPEEEQSRVQILDLEALRPHQDLELLRIQGFGGTTAPSWMISLQNLRSLNLISWDGCECLPPLGGLPFLEDIFVRKMKKVKRVGEEFLGIMPITQASSSASVLFPKLKRLNLWSMHEWERWEEVRGAEMMVMPCLEYLQIYCCSKLMNLPLFLQNTPLRVVTIQACRRSIIMPVWPENCDVRISSERDDPDVTRRDETETRIDEEITIIT